MRCIGCARVPTQSRFSLAEPRPYFRRRPLAPPARTRRRRQLLPRGAGLARDLAERVAAALEVDPGPVLVADHSADALATALEFRRDRAVQVVHQRGTGLEPLRRRGPWWRDRDGAPETGPLLGSERTRELRASLGALAAFGFRALLLRLEDGGSQRRPCRRHGEQRHHRDQPAAPSQLAPD